MANWALAYQQGRCKAIGISWTEEEAHAALVLRIPADFVRQGILTLEDYEKKLKKEKREEDEDKKLPLLHLKVNQLLALCKEYKIEVTDEAPRFSLIEVLVNAGCPRTIARDQVPKAEES